VGDKVKFNLKYLESCKPAERNRLEERVGTVRKPRQGTILPIVFFEAKGRFPEYTLYEVYPTSLVLIKEK
jgi:hypothetical protein